MHCARAVITKKIFGGPRRSTFGGRGRVLKRVLLSAPVCPEETKPRDIEMRGYKCALPTSLCLGLALYWHLGAVMGATVVVGPLRVSALSPQLVRIEPKGPNGFEDRVCYHSFQSVEEQIVSCSESTLDETFDFSPCDPFFGSPFLSPLSRPQCRYEIALLLRLGSK